MRWSLFSLFNRSNIKSGFMPWRLFGLSPQFNDYTKDQEKIAAVFSNPAVLKVFSIQCDLFSMAKVYVYSNTERERVNDPAIAKLAKPNPMQATSQFLWDYMFWKMLGTAYIYVDSDDVNRVNAPIYLLDPSKIEWPPEIENSKDKLIFSQRKMNELMDAVITYRYEDGNTFKFPFRKLKVITDLSNGTGNWFKGYSRIDALYKVISNSEVTLDATNINTRFTGKFLVSGQSDPKDVTARPMAKEEKDDIEKKINGDTWNEQMKGEKQVHAVRSQVDIKRFIDNLKNLGLDDRFKADFFTIGAMYNIPRDVLELYASSTYENQDRARAGHVAYTLEPAAIKLTSVLDDVFGYTNKHIVLSWDHLPFVQTMEADRLKVKNQQANTFINLVRNGVPAEEANAFLDTNFTYTPSNKNDGGSNK